MYFWEKVSKKLNESKNMELNTYTYNVFDRYLFFQDDFDKKITGYSKTRNSTLLWTIYMLSYL